MVLRLQFFFKASKQHVLRPWTQSRALRDGQSGSETFFFEGLIAACLKALRPHSRVLRGGQSDSKANVLFQNIFCTGSKSKFQSIPWGGRGGGGHARWAGGSKRERGERDVRRDLQKKQLEKIGYRKIGRKKNGYEKLGTMKGMTR